MKDIKSKKAVSCAFIILSAILNVISIFVLPSRVTVNVSFSDELTYMNKYTALAFPFLVTTVSSCVYANFDKFFANGKDEESLAKQNKKGSKYLVLAVFGIILTLWVIFRNI